MKQNKLNNLYPRTREEAYALYIKEEWYNFMPFDDNKESSFLDLLESKSDNPYKYDNSKGYRN